MCGSRSQLQCLEHSHLAVAYSAAGKATVQALGSSRGRCTEHGQTGILVLEVVSGGPVHQQAARGNSVGSKCQS